MDKLSWLKLELLPLLKNVEIIPIGKWGKLSFHGMIEHLSDSVKIANGKRKFGLLAPADKVDSYKAFAISDKAFNKSTPNKLMGESPEPLRHAAITDAILELEEDLNLFFEIYEKEPGLVIMNPFFGELSYDENTSLLYKHARHHLLQFGLIEPNE